jgi:predicted Holliday junction resolvase-like endonuclease
MCRHPRQRVETKLGEAVITALTIILTALILTLGVRDIMRHRGQLRLQLEQLASARLSREAELERDVIEAQKAYVDAVSIEAEWRKRADEASANMHRRMEDVERRVGYLTAPGNGVRR